LDCAWFYVPANTVSLIDYMGDGFYRSKDPTNSIKVLTEKATKENPDNTKKTQNTHMHTHTKW